MIHMDTMEFILACVTFVITIGIVCDTIVKVKNG